MFSILRGGASRSPMTLPLFPLKTVLFPDGVLPLKVFEQRYIEMTKACLKDDKPFGVCLLTRGEEVAQRGRTPEFAAIGTLARITSWEMPQLGILHLKTAGGTRFHVQSHAVASDGLIVGSVTALNPEPALALPDAHRPLAELLALMIERAGVENFSAELAMGDASWVGYRLAELLPLPLPIKQSMLAAGKAGEMSTRYGAGREIRALR
ncbi:MAG: peptidase S16 [Betaproteobacteria bacterium]|nr:MAG: peptidase S16 [Betaproteobacteria bacterium]